MSEIKVTKNEIEAAKNYMDSKRLSYSEFWLVSCLKWLKNQCGDQLEADAVHQNVFNQWLLLDLRQSKTRSLPPALKNKKKLTFNGTFAVQCLFVIDIAKSVYSQLQEIRNKSSLTLTYQTDEEKSLNDMNERKTNRCLKLMLSDGSQEIEAIEYSRIPQINLTMKPGCKLYLKGSINVRNGILFLESKNIEIIGGFVEELQIINHYENILAKILKLDINKNVLIEHPKCENTNNNKIEIKESQREEIHPKSEELTTSLLEDVFNEAEFDFEIDNDDIFNQVIDSIEKKPTPVENKQSNFDDIIDLEIDDIFDEIDINQHLDNIDQKIMVPQKRKSMEPSPKSSPKRPPPPNPPLEKDPKKPYDSINDVLEKRQSFISGTKRTVFASFKSITKPLTIIDDKWVLSLVITDFTADLIVDMNHSIIVNLIGYTTKEFLNLRNRSSENNAVLELLTETFEKCEAKLLKKPYVMKLEFNRDNENPIIIELED